MDRAKIEAIAKGREFFRLGLIGENVGDGLGAKDVEAVNGVRLILFVQYGVRADGVTVFHDVSSFLSLS